MSLHGGGDDDDRDGDGEGEQILLARNNSVVVASSMNKRKGSPCSEDGHGDSHQPAKILLGCSAPDLPEDIWHHIHSLLPLRDAARAACLSRAFLCSWRCLPVLIFNEKSLSIHYRDLSRTINRILSNHSSIMGVKILKFALSGIAYCDLDSWLQVATTPGIEQLTVMACRLSWEDKTKYNFTCSLLSEGVRNSVRSLELGFCAFHPTTQLGTLRSLTSLFLYYVSIKEKELQGLLSNSPGLERLDISHCDKITRLQLPCVLERLICLTVFACRTLPVIENLKIVPCCRLRVIENKAPNLSSLDINRKVRGETSQVKNLTISHSRGIYYARAELPSIMPNLVTLNIRSRDEVADTPMLPTKFLYLKHLNIYVTSGTASPPYDYFSLASFLDASPSLETLSLDVSVENNEKQESVIGHSSQWRQMAKHHHCSLKSVNIIGFSSAKSLVELMCYILNNAVSLECLRLDTLYGPRCYDENYDRWSWRRRCHTMSNSSLIEAPRAPVAIRTYIEDKVPARVKFIVVEPCSKCHKLSQQST